MNRSESGSALIMALAITTMLLVLGVSVARVVSVDIDATGSERRAETALYICEAGIQWGLQTIANDYNIDPQNPDYTPLLALAPITGDANCPDATCPLFGWHQLHASEVTRAFNAGNALGGRYRIAVNTGPDPQTLLMRCDARPIGSGRRVIEVAVTSN